MNQSFQNSDNTSIERTKKHPIVPKLDLNTELWIEIKVKEKTIMKRNYHIAFIYKNKYTLVPLSLSLNVNSRLYIHGGYEINTGIMNDFNFIHIEDDFGMNNWEIVPVKSNKNPGSLYYPILNDLFSFIRKLM